MRETMFWISQRETSRKLTVLSTAICVAANNYSLRGEWGNYKIGGWDLAAEGMCVYLQSLCTGGCWACWDQESPAGREASAVTSKTEHLQGKQSHWTRSGKAEWQILLKTLSGNIWETKTYGKSTVQHHHPQHKRWNLLNDVISARQKFGVGFMQKR